MTPVEMKREVIGAANLVCDQWEGWRALHGSEQPGDDLRREARWADLERHMDALTEAVRRLQRRR
jgi:hypothetical protein